MLAIGPKPRENTWLWLAKLVSGALVFTLIIVHIVVNHLISSKGLLSYADVVAYLSNPWIALMESTFLVIVVAHSLLGTRSILLDLNPSASIMRTIDWLFGLIGVVAVVYGIWLIQVIIHSPVGG
jgi:succinate dehydrogenase / fumarate reductase membrane anchor subunit